MGYGQSDARGYVLAREMAERRRVCPVCGSHAQDRDWTPNGRCVNAWHWPAYDREVAREIADDVKRLRALREVFGR